MTGEGPARLAAAADRHVGQRMRERRVQLGLSLAQLAVALGVTTQQARKYESGQNGIPAGRLASLAALLGVEPAWLFDGLNPDPGIQLTGKEPVYVPLLPTRPRMLLELIRAGDRMEDEKLSALCEAARAFVQANGRLSS